MWGSHGPHNYVYGSSGNSLRASAGPDPNHQHFPAATTPAAATAAGAAAASTSANPGHSHAAGPGSTGPAANTVPAGNTQLFWSQMIVAVTYTVTTYGFQLNSIISFQKVLKSLFEQNSEHSTRLFKRLIK